MITVNFDSEKEPYKMATGLWQWDYGQKLRIQGLSLPVAVEIHFSLQQSGGESVTRIGVTEGGVTEASIPDKLLENDGKSSNYYIYAFIYLSNESSGETIYRISMPVKSRPKPVYEKPQDPEERPFQEVVAAVNAAASRAENAEKSAEAWVHGRADYPERNKDNAAYYVAECRQSAELAEQAAEKSGYIQFDIEDGRLIETFTDNANVEFALIEGRLCIL